MRKIIASAWITLDGVFDAETMGQWQEPYHSEERAAVIQAGINACDAMLYGRETYEMLYPYWSSLKNNEMGVAAKLNSVPKYIVSTTLKKAPWENSTIIRDNVEAAVRKLKEQPGGEILMMGCATLTHSLLEMGLVDEFRFLVHPMIMGRGKKFFQEGMPVTALKLVENRALDKGVNLVTYRPAK